jgi:cell division protein FtsI (penicillin-binding protein 3)
MTKTRRGTKQFSNHHEHHDPRIRVLAGVFGLVGIAIIGRLFVLMVLQHSVYAALAAGSHEIYAQLYPDRGTVYVQDSRTKEEYPISMNQDVFTVYADTRKIMDDDTAETVAEGIAEVFSYDDDKKFTTYLNLNKRDDPYEPLEKRVSEDVVDILREKDLIGIGWVRQPERYYPEANLAAQTVGFVGSDEEGNEIGRYGIEGYWEETLAGKGGFFEGITGVAGNWLPLAGRSFEPAEDGADILLTIDRTVQFQTCEILRASMNEYDAISATAVVMEPSNGAVRALCSLPDFDPNVYGFVNDASVYNNDAVFTPYEPGSIFKPITMAAALNEGVLTPTSIFYDTGARDAGCQKAIRNADGKVYEDQTMTGVLENSINTGMVYVVEQLGKEKFTEYVERFGFGIKKGIEIDTEVSGTVASLYENSGDAVDCYTATAAFGQGITATPLQLASAFTAIANGGMLYKPYIVEEVRHANGKRDRIQPKEVGRMLTPQSARLATAMMVKVIDNGHAGHAGVPGYYIAGKTGTAQIAGRGGYSEDTNHSFVGFGPVDDPAFVVLVKFEKPDRRFSASTAAPTFGKIAKFLMEYYQVPPSR